MLSRYIFNAMCNKLMTSRYIIGAMCNKGQPKIGTEYAPYFFDLKHKIPIKSFNKGTGYQELYNIVFDKYHIYSDRRIVIMGGDHSISSASISAINDKLITRNKKLSIVWIDAHADINTYDTSLTGNTHGMSVAFLLGLCRSKDVIFNNIISPNKITYIGLRDVDKAEVNFLKNLNINCYTNYDVKYYGIKTIMAEVKKKVGDDYVHLSLDIDGLDPVFCPATGTPVNDGLTVNECSTIINSFDKLKFRSMDVTEFNPLICLKPDIVKTKFNIDNLINDFYE
jgi:arginase